MKVKDGGQSSISALIILERTTHGSKSPFYFTIFIIFKIIN